MTQFLRMFPGETDFKEVNQKEWDVTIQNPDKDGFGNILNLTADVRVWDKPGGRLLVAKKWPSRSFIRNFARILKMLFSNVNVSLVRNDSALITTGMTTILAGQQGLVPNRNTVGDPGANMAVGDGAPAEDHLRDDLVSRVGPIIGANEGVVTTFDTAATLTLQITQGITISQSGGVTVREIALFMRVFGSGIGIDNQGYATLIAYDGITATPVAQGGVIAPRYTLDFPV